MVISKKFKEELISSFPFIVVAFLGVTVDTGWNVNRFIDHLYTPLGVITN
jgi:predicted cation transporter